MVEEASEEREEEEENKEKQKDTETLLKQRKGAQSQMKGWDECTQRFIVFSCLEV